MVGALNTEKPICLSCLYMDKRPESGINAGLFFCQKKMLILRPKAECPPIHQGDRQEPGELQSIDLRNHDGRRDGVRTAHSWQSPYI